MRGMKTSKRKKGTINVLMLVGIIVFLVGGLFFMMPPVYDMSDTYDASDNTDIGTGSVFTMNVVFTYDGVVIDVVSGAVGSGGVEVNGIDITLGYTVTGTLVDWNTFTVDGSVTLKQVVYSASGIVESYIIDSAVWVYLATLDNNGVGSQTKSLSFANIDEYLFDGNQDESQYAMKITWDVVFDMDGIDNVILDDIPYIDSMDFSLDPVVGEVASFNVVSTMDTSVVAGSVFGDVAGSISMPFMFMVTGVVLVVVSLFTTKRK